jgi:drug/metabolite transporter (DMT)-like permease
MILHANGRGVVAMIVAMGLFVLNDAAMKIATTSMPVSEAVALRGVFASALILVAIGARREGASLRRAADLAILLRAGFDTLNAIAFLTALTMMTLADDIAIQQIVPLLMTAYAAMALRERVTWRKWLAMGAGFTGALLVANPSGQGFGLGAVLAFAATLAVAGRDLTTRHIDKNVPLLVVTLSATITLTVAAAAFAVLGDWTAPSGSAAPILGLAAVLITFALLAVAQAFRWAQVQAVAPFYYAQTIFAVLATYFIFGVAPAPLSIMGMVLVVAAGLYVIGAARRPDHARMKLRPTRSLST